MNGFGLFIDGLALVSVLSCVCVVRYRCLGCFAPGFFLKKTRGKFGFNFRFQFLSELAETANAFTASRNTSPRCW
jgi:hypothetical protein